MIVKDEEDVLERALSSIKDIADEIIIVDTGSTDMKKKLLQNSQIKSLILNGAMISLKRETTLSLKQLKIIACGLMQTMFF